MDATILLLSFVTFLSTFVGGLVVIKFRKILPYFFAFAAGSLLAVVFLDLLPESLGIADSIGIPIRYLMLTIVASFFVYNLIEKFFATHQLGEDSHGHIMGPIGAGSLVVHSFLDGIAIGSAYAVNPAIGLIVAFAVISHDFTDGINTVTIMLKNRQKLMKAMTFLILDAFAPVVGVFFTLVMRIPEQILAFLLAAFVGEFLYIGALTLLPEVHRHPSKKIILTMALGICIIVALTSVI